jgi:hypothetical protein
MASSLQTQPNPRECSSSRAGATPTQAFSNQLRQWLHQVSQTEILELQIYRRANSLTTAAATAVTAVTAFWVMVH